MSIRGETHHAHRLLAERDTFKSTTEERVWRIELFL